MVEHILKNNTRTIESAIIVTQKMQTNGFEAYLTFESDCLGKPNILLNNINAELNKMIDEKMTSLITKNNSKTIVDSQKPISFEIDNKIFYWNPGQIQSKI